MLNYRKANVDDISQLIELRKKQLLDEGIDPNIDIDTELYNFFEEKLNEDTLIQILVEDGREIIACGAIVFYDFPPTYTNKTGKKGYITNMFTKEDYRGQGIATSILNKLVDDAKEFGVSKLWLGASKLGRPVYKKFGFKESDEWLELDVE
ncbi:N-acetyltransferase [Ornithinibacillus bavariensis]|uniref:N-acetyltransferase n=1 Tax=Ornithinibacillus bavariensis TaxID=545502 RepID=A0A919X9F8_9BACI|nr:N-acetyltransferase [Ornithinibacillus bavariensis]